MPPKDDRIFLTDREWRATCDALLELQRSVEKLERENLVWKTKAALVMTLIGTGVGMLVQIAVALLSRH